MIIATILVLLALIIGYLIRSSVDDEIKKTKKKFYTFFVIGIIAFILGIYINEFYSISGVFMLWAGMTK